MINWMPLFAMALANQSGTGESMAMAASIQQAIRSMQAAGQEMPKATIQAIRDAAETRTPEDVLKAVQPLVFLEVTINPEGRVRVEPGPYVPGLKVGRESFGIVKVNNQSGGQQRLEPRCSCAGVTNNPFTASLTTGVGNQPVDLSGQAVEFLVLKIACSKAGPREATIAFHAGQGTEDLGFRCEAAVLFKVSE